MPLNIIRAWKDRDYRNSLNEEQLAALPENPAGGIDLTDITEEELVYMQGGENNDPAATALCTLVPSQCTLCDPPDDDQRNAAIIGGGVVVTATLIATAIVAPPVTVPAVMVATAPVGI